MTTEQNKGPPMKHEGNLRIQTKDEWKKYRNLSEVTGSLYLRGTGITTLPDNLTVGGSLYLRGTGITTLPEGLTVGGSLYLRGTGITTLPEGLTVGGYLDLRGTGITTLPDNLTVGGSLYLRGTGITTLPDNLTVGGSLYLRGTGITTLPEGLTVGGYLDLRGTGITTLPDNLTVGGSLYLRGTGITTLPDNLTVGGYLDLQGTGITTLPEGLTVGGYLDLQGTGITTLPEGLTVGGYLDLQGTGITTLPEGLTVGGYLDLRGTGITAPEKVKRPSADFSIKLKASIEVKFNLRGWTIADGLFAKILSTKGAIRKILVAGKKIPSYLAKDEKGNYAHGDTAHAAVQELAFKLGDRNIEEYKNMPPNTRKSPQDWAFVYRMVTGACQFGVKNFIEQKGKLKKTYTLSEILVETKGAFGHDKFQSVVAGGAS